MKHLTIVRHAKSSWKDAASSDFERPLNARGERDAPEMGRRLAARSPAPDRILSSSAARARRTAEVLAREIGCDPGQIEFRETLYLAGTSELMAAIESLDDTWEHVLFVGHNPGLSELLNLLADAHLDELPTCGVAELELALDSWREVRPGVAERMQLDFPKRPLA
jgi:phosphohistidine phosphatase